MARARKPIRWLYAAHVDLAEIVETIARDKPAAAEGFARAILRKIERLADFPYLGSVSPYFRKARQLSHKKYVIYYTVHRDEIVVRAVVHGSRIFRSAWFRRES